MSVVVVFGVMFGVGLCLGAHRVADRRLDDRAVQFLRQAGGK